MIRKLKSLLCIWLVCFTASHAFGVVTQTFFAPSSAGANNGTSCANARAVSTYTSADSGSDKEVVLCPATYTSVFALAAGGTSGHPTLLTLQPGTNFSKANWGTLNVISINNRDWVVLDGGATGQIFSIPGLDTWVEGGKVENTAVGSTSNPTVDTSCVAGQPTNHTIIKNMSCDTLYVKTTNDNLGGGDGIHIWGTDNRVTNSQCSNAKQCISVDYIGTATNLEIDHNLVSHSNFATSSADRPGNSAVNGLKVHDNDTAWGPEWDNPAQNNFHHSCYAMFINDSGASVTNGSYYYNYCHGDPGGFSTGGLFLDSESNGLGGAWHTFYAYSNLFYNSSPTNTPDNGFIITKSLGAPNSVFPTVFAYNNTMASNGINQGRGCVTDQGALMTLANNIVQGCTEYFIDGGASGTLVSSDYSDYFQIHNWGPSSGANLTLGAWQSATGFDSHSFVGDPLFTGTFGLGTGSPAIGTGFNFTSLGIPALDIDMAGNARPASGGWDIGAFQAGGTPTAVAPSFSPVAGTYSTTQTLTISTTSGGVICYTTNGTTPATNGTTGCTTGTLYSGTISVAVNTTFKAIAGGTGFVDSSVSAAAYVLQGSVPVPSPGAGSYSATQNVTLAQAQSLAICYTTNGATPASTGTGSCSTGTLYTGAITVASSLTLKAIAMANGYTDSNVLTAAYTITTQVPAPAIGLFAISRNQDEVILPYLQ